MYEWSRKFVLHTLLEAMLTCLQWETRSQYVSIHPVKSRLRATHLSQPAASAEPASFPLRSAQTVSIFRVAA